MTVSQVTNLRRAAVASSLALAFVAGGATNAALSGPQPDIHLQPGDRVTVIADIPAPSSSLIPSTSATAAATPSPSPTPSPTPVVTPAPTPSQVVPNGTIVPATKGALAAAISSCAAPCTLWLRGGSHVVNSMIVTSKAITIQAYPGETPVVTDAGGRPDLLYFEGGPVTVRGITFATSAASPTFDDTGGSALLELRGSAHDVLLEDDTFLGTAKMSTRQQLVYITGKSATLKNITIRRVSLVGNGTKGYGIHIYDSAAKSVDGITIDSIRGEGFGTNHAVVFWANVANGRLINSDFYGGNAVRYHQGLSVAITGNRGHGVKSGLQADTTSGLTTSGNVWTLP